MPEWRQRVQEMRLVKPGDLADHPLQHRLHSPEQRAHLVGILDEIGIAGALLAWYSARNGGALTAIDGHLRKSLDPDVPWPTLITDLNDQEADILLMAYDWIGAQAQSGRDELARLLGQVQPQSEQVQRLQAHIAEQAGLPWGPAAPEPQEAPEPQIDRAAELQAQWGTELGQLWMINSTRVPGRCHRVLCGDSTNAADVARLMGGQQAALCFTSPPYAQQRDYDGQLGDWEMLMRGVFAHVPMIDEGQVFVNLGLIHADGEWLPYWEGWIAWMRAQGWRRFGWYVWDQGHGLPGDWNGRFAPAFEFIFHFNRQARTPRKMIATLETIRPRRPQKLRAAATGKPPQGLRNADGTISCLTSLDAVGQLYKIPDSVVRIGREQARGIHTRVHPAVFPDELPAFFLTAYIEGPEAIAYEPFAGSGSTIVAGEQVGCPVYAMEIVPAYVAVTLQRLADMGLTPRLLEAAAHA